MTRPWKYEMPILYRALYPETEQVLWNDKLLWTRGYFASSIGNASAETIQAYIDAQG